MAAAALRDLFQYMNQRYAQQGTYFDDSEGVRCALEALTGNDFRDFFSRYISGTEELPYNRVLRLRRAYSCSANRASKCMRAL